MLEPYLRQIFGFIGVDSPEFVNAQPLNFVGPEVKAATIAKSRDALAALAKKWTIEEAPTS